MKNEKLFRTIYRIAIAVFIIGMLFKIMHWPYALEISVVGLSAIAISSCLYFYSKSPRSFFDQLGIVLVPLWCALALARILHVPYRSEIRITIFAIGLIYTGYHGFIWYQKDKKVGAKKFDLERTSFIVGLGLVGVGLFLKFRHWPYASTFLIAGLAVSAIYFLASAFKKED